MKFAEDLRVIAGAHEEDGEYEVAQQLYRRALKAQSRLIGKDDPELAPYIYDLAMISAALDRDAEARDLFAWLVAIVPQDAELLKEVELVLSELQDAPSAA